MALSATALRIQDALLDVDGFASGEAVAQRLGISRTAVSKAVAQLNEAGAVIEAAHRRGYRLVRPVDLLTSEGIRSNLSEQGIDPRLVSLVDETASTNLDARMLADQGAQSFTTVVANHQTAGKGRRGRAFFSPPATGIYLSMVYRPQQEGFDAAFITGSAAVAVCRAIERAGLPNAGIKWVNDVYAENKKVCGILTEAVADLETGGVAHVVVGVGINVYVPTDGYPQSIANRAGALCDTIQIGLRNRIAAYTINQLHHSFCSADTRDFMDEYRDRSILCGRRVVVESAQSGVRSGNALGIDDNMRLIVHYDTGETENLSSSEASVRLE